ncbi:MAG: hypothetical protein KKI15_15815 [Proteobacteria bacterium]|nr:hypothetical protein [Pseudomonadota bacterium]
MKKVSNATNDEGFVLVLCLLIMMVLSVGGIMATRSATTDVKISGNERSIKNNLYQGEAVSTEGSQCIGNQSSMIDLRAMGDWLGRVDGKHLTAAQQTEMDNLEEGNLDEWAEEMTYATVINRTCFSTVSGIDDGSQAIAKRAYGLGIASGSDTSSSLKMTANSAMYNFKIIGISAQDIGKKTVEIGFRKRLDTSEQ